MLLTFNNRDTIPISDHNSMKTFNAEGDKQQNFTLNTEHPDSVDCNIEDFVTLMIHTFATVCKDISSNPANNFT